jgi:SAM-dependent methyltransferase
VFCQHSLASRSSTGSYIIAFPGQYVFTLETDYWNRFYLDDKSNFSKAPNAFLVQVIQGKPPGAALDYAMGQGRNAIYLAGLGWRVSGFDPAGAAVAIAQTRAKELGLTLDTAAVRDSEYDFGKERFDLILFSWSMPLIPVKKVLDSLRPGGMVVMECAADYVGRNGMLKMFDDLQIVRYEIVRAKADSSLSVPRRSTQFPLPPLRANPMEQSIATDFTDAPQPLSFLCVSASLR